MGDAERIKKNTRDRNMKNRVDLDDEYYRMLQDMERSGLKWCSSCETWKPKNEKTFTTLKGRLLPQCRRCSNGYKNEWERAKRSDDEYRENRNRRYAETRLEKYHSDEEYREITLQRKRDKLENDLGYKISTYIGNAINNSLKKGKGGHWEDIVGYTWEDLKAHIENQFTDRMNWENWGSVWEIHHRRPIADHCFSSVDGPEFIECWSIWNLEPLEKEENRRISCRVEEPPLPLLP